MKKFNVSFTETTKYNPVLRTVLVETKDDFTAKQFVLQRFGRSKVSIDKVEEVK
jgi:hypothetical protein